MTDRSILLEHISEREWLEYVVAVAQRNGWLAHHLPDARRLIGDAGAPDLLLVRHGVLIAAELKAHSRRKPTDEQMTWLAALAMVEGVRVAVWRPADVDLVREILEGRAP